MSMQFEVVSNNSLVETYTIHLPFSLEPTGSFPALDNLPDEESLSLIIEGREAMIKRKPLRYVIFVPGFNSESEAREFIQKICAGLLWLSLKQKMSISFQPEPVPLQKLQFPLSSAWEPAVKAGWKSKDDGTVGDGGMFFTDSAIIPEHKQIVQFPALLGKLSRSVDVDRIVNAFNEANAEFEAERIFNNAKLTLAFAIFSAAYSHYNRISNFINLVTVLR